MKVSILGCGETSNIWNHGRISEKQARKLIADLGTFLAATGAEIIIVPARGVPYEVALAYRKAGGKKIIGLVPANDKVYGTGHIREFMHIIEEKINVGTWHDLNGVIASKGDFAVCLGLSCGAMLDMSFLKYRRKYLGNTTKLIIFINTISARLHPEIEKEIKPVYVSSLEELSKQMGMIEKR